MLKKLKGNKDVACAKQENPDSLRARFGGEGESGVHENGIHASDNKVSFVELMISWLHMTPFTAIFQYRQFFLVPRGSIGGSTVVPLVLIFCYCHSFFTYISYTATCWCLPLTVIISVISKWLFFWAHCALKKKKRKKIKENTNK